jgi:hypothetical protein
MDEMDTQFEPASIELVIPPTRAWLSVARLVLGGVADRLDLGYEDLDDLQLAVERLLVEAAADEPIRMSVEVLEQGVRVGLGPLREQTIAEALQGPEAETGELTLRRILETVVDSFAVDQGADGTIVVRLQKAARRT